MRKINLSPSMFYWELPIDKFARKYLKFKLPYNWHHDFLFDILMNRAYLNKETSLIETMKEPRLKKVKNKTILVMMPRFHSKSTILSFVYPLWEIYRNPNVRILIVSANEEIAVGFSRQILWQLENNEKLIRDLGYLAPSQKRKWGEKAFIVKRDTIEKDPTVAAVGAGGKLISRRADIIIIDDLIDINTARTPAMRRKTKEWFENVVLPILEENEKDPTLGRLIVTGTAWYKGDLYDEIMEERDFDFKVKLKALMYHGGYLKAPQDKRQLPYDPMDWPQALDAKKVFASSALKRYRLYEKLKSGVLWPDKWPFEKLMEKKKNMTDASFSRQYLNEPMSEKDTLFKMKYIKKALEKRPYSKLVSYWNNLDKPIKSYGDLIVAVGVDLAISKKERADYSAIAVWGLNNQRERILLWLDYGKWSLDEIKQKIYDVYEAFSPVKIRVESVGFQNLLVQELEGDIPVEGFHTTGYTKHDPKVGLAHVALLFEQEKISIPPCKTVPEQQKKVQRLLQEFLTYSQDEHAGDLLMASWFALDVLREFDKQSHTFTGFFSPEALIENRKKVKAAHRVLLLSHSPRFYKIAFYSLVYIFRPATKKNTPFVEDDERFFILATRGKDRSVAYIIEKDKREIVGKVEGKINALMYASLLERAGYFFNKAQVIVDRKGEGEAVYRELVKRRYPNLICMQPDKEGQPVMKEGIVIDEKILPVAVDYFKQVVDNLEITIPDQQLLKEMGETLGVEGDKMIMSFGEGTRIKCISTAIWLIDNYDKRTFKLYNKAKARIRKKLKVPYLVFN